MANVAFKKGLLATLPTTHAEGTFYVTTDERAIYLDVSDSARIRLVDFQEFATLAALQDNKNPSTTALYYVTELNVLAKWDGTQYVQINLDTGATSFEVVGDGNAVTTVSYDKTTRELTLTKGKTFAEKSELDALNTYVGTIPNESKATDIVGYVQEKTEGIATDAALTKLSGRVTTAEGEIDALQTASATHALATDLAAETTRAEAAEKANAASIKAINDDYLKAADKTTLQNNINTVDGKVNTLIGDDTSKSVRTIAGEVANGKDAAIKKAQDAADAAQNDVDALEDKVGAVANGKTVVEMIGDAQAAATYNDTVLKNRVSTNETAIATLNGDENTAGSVKKQVADAVAKIVADAPEAYDTLKEISDWITSHADSASAMNTQINTNKTNIEALTNLVGTLPEGINAKTIVAYIQEAISDLASVYDAKGSAAQALTDAKTYADQAETDAISAAKTYADGLAKNYDAAGTAKAAVEALDVADAAVAGSYVSAVSQTDGKIKVTRATLPVMEWGSF